MTTSTSKFLNVACPQLDGAVARLRELGGTAPKAVARGMRSWAEQVRTAALRVTPKKWGTLRDSIFVKQDVKGVASAISIGAGGPAAPYAVVMHEKLFSNYTTRGTGAKYLENPIREAMPKLDGEVSRELDKEIAKAGKK